MLHRKPSGVAESKHQDYTNDVTSEKRRQRPSPQAEVNENRHGKICVITPAKGGPSRVQWGQRQASRPQTSNYWVDYRTFEGIPRSVRWFTQRTCDGVSLRTIVQRRVVSTSTS